MVRRRQRKPAASNMGVYCDHQRRTCLLVEGGGLVKFIPLDINGFQVHRTADASFSQRYKLMSDYPVQRAAQLYLGYALNLGATAEVLDYLGKIIEISDDDRATILEKDRCEQTDQSSTNINKEPSTSSKKQKVEKSSSGRRRAARVKQQSMNGYSSAAKMFQALIMAGELTDDEIFTQVQVAFGLEDKKRSYVQWYRKHLIKQGENPPEEKK